MNANPEILVALPVMIGEVWVTKTMPKHYFANKKSIIFKAAFFNTLTSTIV